MKIRLAALAALTLTAFASAPAFASSQLAANAGLSPSEAAGLTLTEIAAAKFSRGADGDDRQWIVSRDGPTDPALLGAATPAR